MRSSAEAPGGARPSGTGRKRRRAWTQAGFFALFVLAPPLDLLRIDLTRGHAILLGQDWTLGIDGLIAGTAGPGEAALNLFLHAFLPLVGGALLFLSIAWRYGRLYCGWLCPHFSVVELVNRLMRRAIGRPTLWERRRPGDRTDPRYRVITVLTAVGLAFLWAVVLLTYLLPPAEVYGNLISGALTRNQAIFLTAATLAFTTDFLLARHLFCRFGCAVGLFQSLAWMANDRAMVVRFDTTRAKACADCDDACDRACPMRLKPRTIKRSMFTCTQCSECISACTRVLGDRPGQSLLTWAAGADALATVTGRPAPPAETRSHSACPAAANRQGRPPARAGA